MTADDELLERIKTDVRALVDYAIKAGANVDVVYEADGTVRISIYPIEVSEKKEGEEP